MTLSYLNSSGAVSGLNSFGQVSEQKWTVTGTLTKTDDFDYIYDANSNITSETNTLHPSLNETYTYDAFNQLSNCTGATQQSWAGDPLGDSSSITTNGVPQARTYNNQNELTSVGSNTLTYDANGNLTTDENGNQYKYDAWNRLVQVKDQNNNVLASYTYDALGRRIQETENGTTTDLYYSTQGQVLEEQQGGQATARYVWSPVSVNTLVLRDDQFNSAGTPQRRLYVQQDVNSNVTALVDGTPGSSTYGTVVERYSYTPYGQVTVMDSNWNPLSGSGPAGSLQNDTYGPRDPVPGRAV